MNAIGQREQVVRSQAIPVQSSTLTSWAYDPLGQVTSADATDTTANRSYQYDSIGNRKKSANSLTLPDGDSYAVNALNQYTYLNNWATSGNYDADGNATHYPTGAGDASFDWDAENRLKSAVVNTLTRTDYFYDASGRRIAKTSSGCLTYYIYDGWNVIAEYISNAYCSDTLVRAYLWGADLSGSMQGAGGVGGLLAVRQSSSMYYNSPSGPGELLAYYPAFDGNGNVTEYLDSSGALAANFTYDPFGNAPGNSDNYADFRYRFSTKPLDSETGLYYYGYRWYDPLTGRWPSRDPIEEEGGLNLYGFVWNDGVGSWDILGMAQPYTDTFKTIKEAIVAGGEYALAGAIRNLEDRRAKWRHDRDEFDRTKGKRTQSYMVSEPRTIFEYCGVVCRSCRTGHSETYFVYYFASAGTLWETTFCNLSITPRCKSGDDIVGGYHNHPHDGVFSPEDKSRPDEGPFGVTWIGSDGKPKTKILPFPEPPIIFPLHPLPLSP